MGLEIKLLVGHESKAFLVDLDKSLARMEKIAKMLRSPGEIAEANGEEEETETASDDGFGEETETASDDGFGEETEQSDDFADAEPAPAKKRGRPAKEEKTAAPVKEAKAAKTTTKVTIDDVNDACKAKLKSLIDKRGISGKDARDLVLKVLKKHFNTSSVSELDAKDYGKAIELMKG